MKNEEEMTSTLLDHPPIPPQRKRRWLLIGSLAFAFMFALGVGALIGSSPGTTSATALASNGSQTLAVVQGSTSSSQTQFVAPGSAYNAQPFAAGPRAGGQCEAMTVSSVNGTTIVAKTSSGSSVIVHTTASTRYTQAGKAVAASTIKVGTQINIMGTHNSDGSITATSIDIG
ncbi:MAG: hypothetical protein NVS4B7_05230 [Ktedonobacteraceae bacterium]